MRKRLIQIFGFLISSLGWLFVLCTMAMDNWRISQVGGEGGSYIIKVAWYWSNLWKDCYTESTAVTHCRDYTVIWNVVSSMGYRTTVMYTEMGCFVVCVAGWILVCSTMPTEIWTWSEVSGIVLTSSNYFSNLWKDCVSDSTGVSSCKGIPSLFALSWDIHMCRALIITCIILASFGSILVLVGMKCTKIGGSEITNAKVTFAGGMNYLAGGVCSMVAYSYYGNKLRTEFQDPSYVEQKFEIGVGVYVGWGGSTLLVVGGLVYSILAGREACSSRPENVQAYQVPGYTFVPSRKSFVSSARTEITESRKSRSSSESRASSISAISSTTKTTGVQSYV
ncbi:claudin-10 [Nematolebias whitei]|uniref:claudin-10 n=1 Tax=Nematolebias whitei TaxID=451745 RepID=UPI00189B19F0|nr:claudin-10 [Nematolebias whitei]